MISFLHSILNLLYIGLIKIGGYFNPKAKLMIQGREGLFNKIERDFLNNSAQTVWFHCASLGEFEQGRPVIEAFRIKYPDFKIVLTFFSPSGYEVRKNYAGADFIYYLPFDSKKNAERFIEIIQPALVIFVKYEFWHHFIKTINSNKIPLILISANFRKDQIFFRNYGSFFRDILKRFTHLFVQNSASKILLESIDIHNVTISGDTRFDRVLALSTNALDLPLIEKFKNGKQLFVIGSAWAEDIDFLMPLFDENDKNFKIIVAPHDINVIQIEKWKSKFGKNCKKYSELAPENDNFDKTELLIIDNVGMLSGIYKYADFTWIGGAFGKGLHNILEAATFGMPIFFGSKNYLKFQEAVDLVELKGAFEVSAYQEFHNIFKELNTQNTFLAKTGNICKEYVAENVGATQQIMNYIDLKLMAK